MIDTLFYNHVIKYNNYKYRYLVNKKYYLDCPIDHHKHSLEFCTIVSNILNIMQISQNSSMR